MSIVLTKSYVEPLFDTKEILRYAMCKDADENVTSLLNECLDEIKGKLAYKVCYIQLPTDALFTDVKSEVLSKYLFDCNSYVIFAATVGIELDRLITKYSRTSPAKAHMFQAIGAERIEALCDTFCEEIKLQYKNTKPRIGPGYGDMPLKMQKEIFNILDCSRKIGLTLNDSMMMSPTKSVTAFIGVLK